MRVRMFKREAFAPGCKASGRWVPHGIYAGSLDNCVKWLPRPDGGGQSEVGQEYLLVEIDSDARGPSYYVRRVATVRIEEPPRELVAVRI